MHIAGLIGIAVLWWIVWAVSNAVQDAVHAWRGTRNPRLQLRLERAKAARTWYGPLDYVRDLISDGLQRRTQDRRLRAARAAFPVPADVEPEVVKPAVVPVPDLGPTPTPPVTPPEDPHPQSPATATDNLPTRSWTPIVIPGGAGRDATDEPPSRTSTSPEGTATMTTTAEILGLDHSISYAEDLAKEAAAHGPAGAEGYIGHLQASNVSGASIATAHQMQQAAEALRAAAEAHAEELKRQKTVQEAYDQNPDAGDQGYLQNGR